MHVTAYMYSDRTYKNFKIKLKEHLNANSAGVLHFVRHVFMITLKVSRFIILLNKGYVPNLDYLEIIKQNKHLNKTLNIQFNFKFSPIYSAII